MPTPTDTSLLKAIPDHLRPPTEAERQARRRAATARRSFRAAIVAWLAARVGQVRGTETGRA